MANRSEERLTSLRLSGLLGILAVGSMALSFVYQWYVITTLGAGSETDALVAAMVIPQLVLAVLSGSMTQVLVPLLSVLEGEDATNATWGFVVTIGGLFAIVSLLLIVSMHLWVPWTVPGFTTVQVELTLQLAGIQLARMLFIALTAVQVATCQARMRFVWAETSGLISAVGALIFLAWGLPRFGIVIGAWGLFLRSFLQTLLLIPALGRPRWPNWHRVPLREAWARVRPLLVGTAYFRTDPLVDRILTSLALPGSMTLLNLVQQLYSAGLMVFNKAIASPMVPVQAKVFAGGCLDEFKLKMKRQLWISGLLSASVWLVIAVVAKYIVPRFWIGGAVDQATIHDFFGLIVCLSGMFLCGSIGTVTSASYYAIGDTKTPTKIGIITYTVYIPLKILAFVNFGVYGLALSISLFYLVNLVLQMRGLRFANNICNEQA